MFTYCGDYVHVSLRYTSMFKFKLNYEPHLAVRRLIILNMRAAQMDVCCSVVCFCHVMLLKP